MKPGLTLFALIVCFMAGACAAPGAAPAGVDQFHPASGGAGWGPIGPASGSPRDDYPGPALTGGGGGA